MFLRVKKITKWHLSIWGAREFLQQKLLKKSLQESESFFGGPVSPRRSSWTGDFLEYCKIQKLDVLGSFQYFIVTFSRNIQKNLSVNSSRISPFIGNQVSWSLKSFRRYSFTVALLKRRTMFFLKIRNWHKSFH